MTTTRSGEGTGSVREARPGDIPRILELVHELAVYEREPEAAKGTAAGYAAALFPDSGSPTAFAHVAEVDGEVVAMAVWFLTFSTWTGTNGIHLEDLYVSDAHRGSGLGTALLRTLAGICVERGYPRLEWWVLRWNTPSIGFYDALGAEPMDSWIDYRLDGPALRALGGVA